MQNFYPGQNVRLSRGQTGVVVKRVAPALEENGVDRTPYSVRLDKGGIRTVAFGDEMTKISTDY